MRTHPRNQITTIVLCVAIAILAIGMAYLIVQLGNIQSKLVLLSSQISGLSSALSNLSSATPNNSSNQSTTLANIDVPLNTTEISIINAAPDSYFEAAGMMFMNGSFSDTVFATKLSNKSLYAPFVVNGKPSVIYIGAVSCIFCAENRWAMALALSRFGSFSSLYKGYSALQDGDIPTLYWSKVNYTTPSGVDFGNGYTSSYINFISGEYESPITQGFNFSRRGVAYFIDNAPNSTYKSAMEFMNSTNKFSGTPFTFWGNVIATGADAIIFGNTLPTSASNLPLQHMSHAQILGQLQQFNDAFAWSEYAAADVYIAYVCPSISNSAPVCSLPAIRALEARLGI